MVSSGLERLVVRCAVINETPSTSPAQPLFRIEMDIRRAPPRLRNQKGDRRSKREYRAQSQETASEYRLHGRLN